eukprot:1156388-Pelagomonas_calceolata.AAC.8
MMMDLVSVKACVALQRPQGPELMLPSVGGLTSGSMMDLVSLKACVALQRPQGPELMLPSVLVTLQVDP